jgi:methyl-accepting chemotaxis protein
MTCRSGARFIGLSSLAAGEQRWYIEVAAPAEAVTAGARATMFTQIAIGSGCLIGALGMLWFAAGSISRPIRQLTDAVREVATGDGDLTKRLNIRRSDEIGELAHWFDAFVENVHTIVREVSGTTREVASAATQIAASSEEMAQGLRQQQEQTTRVSAAIAEMSASVAEVASRSSEAAAAASSSGAQATSGGEVVERTIGEIRMIAEHVTESSQSVGALGEKSEQIGRIIGVIDDIADQTNLLALNAAIEAARAGEHGRGFAVVADAVRKLAERTTGATGEVSRSIREIQDETKVAVARIESGTQRVSSGVELAGQAGGALRQIVASSISVKEVVESIASAAREQSSASAEIARNVEQINDVTRESTQAAGQASAAATQLSQRAERLRTLVDRFKI